MAVELLPNSVNIVFHRGKKLLSLAIQMGYADPVGIRVSGASEALVCLVVVVVRSMLVISQRCFDFFYCICGNPLHISLSSGRTKARLISHSGMLVGWFSGKKDIILS